ncbi:MAG: InlB B-repeat-containing protein [Agathobacter sp.]|nr:InlB B-repeat-containing protein [Agathobacter sp.]
MKNYKTIRNIILIALFLVVAISGIIFGRNQVYASVEVYYADKNLLDDSSGNWKYKVINSKSKEVRVYPSSKNKGLASAKKSVTIPEKIVSKDKKTTYKVTEITGFAGTKIEKVIIPPTCKKIVSCKSDYDDGDYYDYGAFEFSNLSKVVFKDIRNSKLEVIGDDAFDDSCITEIVIPASCNQISKCAFSTEALEKVSFENIKNSKLKSIDEYAFYYSSIESITIPDSCKSIGEGAFEECPYLTKVHFGNNSVLEEIGDGAFNNWDDDGCDSKIDKIVIPSKKLKKIYGEPFCYHVEIWVADKNIREKILKKGYYESQVSCLNYTIEYVANVNGKEKVIKTENHKYDDAFNIYASKVNRKAGYGERWYSKEEKKRFDEGEKVSALTKKGYIKLKQETFPYDYYVAYSFNGRKYLHDYGKYGIKKYFDGKTYNDCWYYLGIYSVFDKILVGWDINPKQTPDKVKYKMGQIVEFDYVPKKNGDILTLYPIWKDAAYNITFNSNDGKKNKVVKKIPFLYNNIIGKIRDYSKPYIWNDSFDYEKFFTRANYKIVAIRDENSKVYNINTDKPWGIPIKKDTSFDVIWAQTAVTINYKPDGGSGYMDSATFDINDGYKVGECEFSKSGSEFIGWRLVDENEYNLIHDNLQEENNVNIITPGTTVTQKKLLYELLNIQEQRRRLYQKGLYTNYKDINEIDLTGQVNLYPVWGRGSYKIKYMKNGASGGDMSFDKAYFDTPFKLPDCAYYKKGYKFIGWSTKSSDKTPEYGKGDSITKSQGTNLVTLYAIWSPITYKVHYDSNGGEGYMGDSTFTYNEPGTLKPNAFLKTGSTFAGWIVHSSEGEITYEEQAVVQNLAFNEGDVVTLSAKWDAASVKINLNPNGGICSVSCIEAYFGESFGELPSATKAGAVFEGWFTAPTGGQQILQSSTVNATSDITLYAHWKENTITITFNPMGGNIEKGKYSINCVANTPVGILPNAAKKNNRFKGWFSAKKGGTKLTSTTKLQTSQTFYAQWEEKEPGTKTVMVVLKPKAYKNASGYVVQYSTSRSFSRSKTSSVSIKKSSGKRITVKIPNVKLGKTYYFRVRGYKTKKNGKKSYGAYSAVEKRTFKK